MTSDFRRVMEEISGKDLALFFRQWLFTGGHPTLSGSWSYNAKLKEVTIDLKQVQKGAFFRFPLQIAFIGAGGEKEIKSVQVEALQSKFTIKTALEPVDAVLDPETWLLYEGAIQKK
ncbi:MAG: hypothetical protein JNL53_14055 [Cyclobacteriaceae bacterium]|nr:hypothetical protein [Cyclobacteriaceae bacterium]